MMRFRKHLLTVAAGASLALLAAVAVVAQPSAPAPLASTPVDAAPGTDLVQRGGYIARLGDCVACHTAPGGQPMAGGLALETPFGTLYSTNITPDARTGIGGYSFEQFDRAMRRGIAADGHNLYPAMPYPSYARMTEDDMRALFAYMMKGVAAVSQPNQPAELTWPFSMRWGLALWNWAFLDEERFTPDPARDAVTNRGAYLVQGLGHCGSCHTPRGIAFQEKAMSDRASNGDHYLAGEKVENWRALSLRNLWTVEDTVQVLRTGQNRFATVSGNMAEVISHSTQHFTDADLTAIATYLKSLPPGKGELAMQAAPKAPDGQPPASLFATRGGLGYAQYCVTCHRQGGEGVKDIFPPLAGNPTIASANPETLLHVTLTGWKTPQTAAHPRGFTMPGFAELSNEEIAEILTFVRSSWGNKAAPVRAAMVEEMREELGLKPLKPASFAAPKLADMLAAANADQLVRGMRLHLETKKLVPANVGNDLNCGSCHTNAGTVAGGSPFVGVSAMFPSYGARAGRVITLEERINGCFLRSMNGKPLPKESADMKAMVAYYDWMKNDHKMGDKVPGRGIGKVDGSLVANVDNGRKVYDAQCAVCHGANGEGLKKADGTPVFPALWGDASFNIGAGMARTYKAADFVKANMPFGVHGKFPLGQGSLTDQDAVDVAEFFTHQPRPDFAAKDKDFPKDKKPKDYRY
nr:c-type cytochrome [Ramlibacter lithotrophicus]